MTLRSRVALPCTFSNATFARFVPFGDGREVITRRGAECGTCRYGFERSRRTVVLHGVEVPIVCYEDLLSPPPRTPGSPPIVDASHFHPVSDVVYLPDAEVLLRRQPEGFNEDEIGQILRAIEFES